MLPYSLQPIQLNLRSSTQSVYGNIGMFMEGIFPRFLESTKIVKQILVTYFYWASYFTLITYLSK